jgi:hypothetical protein
VIFISYTLFEKWANNYNHSSPLQYEEALSNHLSDSIDFVYSFVNFRNETVYRFHVTDSSAVIVIFYEEKNHFFKYCVYNILKNGDYGSYIFSGEKDDETLRLVDLTFRSIKSLELLPTFRILSLTGQLKFMSYFGYFTNDQIYREETEIRLS